MRKRASSLEARCEWLYMSKGKPDITDSNPHLLGTRFQTEQILKTGLLLAEKSVPLENDG